MPLFKKFIETFFIIFIILFGFYYVFYEMYKANIDYSINMFKEANLLIAQITKLNLVTYIFKPIYEGFMDTVVYVFTFKYKTIPLLVKTYLIFTSIITIPFIFTLFKYLTFRGLKAFKLQFKKAKANPFYYRDWQESNKISTYDNLDETNMAIMPIIITFRIIFLVIIFLLMPLILIIYLLALILGIIKGITNTGRALDFD